MATKMNKQKLTWKDIVRDALLELGRQGHLSEINKIVEGHPKTKTNPTWRDTIRRVVRQYKIFEPLPPERSGIYKVVEETHIKPGAQNFTEEPEIDHGIAQGIQTQARISLHEKGTSRCAATIQAGLPPSRWKHRNIRRQHPLPERR